MFLDENALAKYIGVPFVHKGRDLKGLDCWGLIRMIYREIGIEIKDLDDYEPESNKKGRDCFRPYNTGEWIKHEKPEPLDVVLFIDNLGIAFHAGIIVPGMKLMHASRKDGVICIELSRLKINCEIDGFYRLKVGK